MVKGSAGFVNLISYWFLTGGYYFWNPYIAENVSISLVVNIQSGTVRRN